METFENFDEQDEPNELYVYRLRPSPEYWRYINSYRTGVIRVKSYHIRTRSILDALLRRTNVQPWLKLLLKPYYLFYSQN